MSILGLGAGAVGSGFYPTNINQSLRFEDGDSPYLTLVAGDVGAGNRKTFTLSFWIKFSNQTGQYIFSSYGSNSNNGFFYLSRQSDGTLKVAGYSTTWFTSTAVFRDTTNFYHIVLRVDSDNETGNNIIRVYVNNTLLTGTRSNPADDFEFAPNTSGEAIRIGGNTYNDSADSFVDGYMAEVNFLDGQSLAPTSFGSTKNNLWVAKGLSGLTYGTNGFRLTFSNSSDLGENSANASKDLTVNGLASTDIVPDSPTNNFATLLGTSGSWTGTLQEGNLKATTSGSSAWSELPATFGISSGKWYFEAVQVGSNDVGFNVGIVKAENYHTSSGGDGVVTGSFIYYSPGYLYSNGGSAQTSYGDAFGDGEVVGIAIDLDNNTIVFYNENVSQGSVSITADTTYLPFIANYRASTVVKVNFGSDSSFSGTKTSGSANATDGKYGDFFYAPPSGYKAMCRLNLDNSVLSASESEQPIHHFDTLIYDGNGSDDRSFTSLNFRPDLNWIKNRSNAGNDHVLTDSSRGGDNQLTPNEYYSEGTATNKVESLDATGFTFGQSVHSTVNANSNNYVAWNWRCGGSTPSKTYKVVVVIDSGNKFRFRNSADSATFAQSAVTLNLQELGTYTFDVSDSSMSGHVFKFSTTSDGTHGGGSEYTTGVTTSGTSGQNGAYVRITVASSAPTLYYFCSSSGHTGMGGQINTNTTFGSTNFDGSILSVSQSNETAGFSITTYTGSGSAGTIGHGLNKTPMWLILKNRTWNNSDSQWTIWFGNRANAFSSDDNYVLFNTNAGYASSGGAFYKGTEINTKTFGLLAGNSQSNSASYNYIVYAFAEVEGFSKFGSYTATGSSPLYIYTGFTPAWIMMKSVSANGYEWVMIDNKRTPLNERKGYLRANQNAIENTSNNYIDIVSNGFVIRSTGTIDINTSGHTVMYMAFASQDTKFNIAV